MKKLVLVFSMAFIVFGCGAQKTEVKKVDYSKLGEATRFFFNKADTGGIPNPIVLESGLSQKDVQKRSYKSYVRECVDLLMEYGTDHYGEKHLPVFANILDVRTRISPSDAAPLRTNDLHWPGQYRNGFWKPTGSNFFLDQPLIDVLGTLSTLEGDDKYRKFRDKFINASCQIVDSKGFFQWGWHRYYDIHKDKNAWSHGNQHELAVIRPRWEELWAINPEATRKEIENIWKWHIIDKETGDHNRHSDGTVGCPFGMSGAEFFYAFCFLGQQTGEQVWLDRARLIADYHWKHRCEPTDLLPEKMHFYRREGTDNQENFIITTVEVGLHCYYLLKCWEMTKDETYKQYAVTYLKAWEKYAYDEKTGKFWALLDCKGNPRTRPMTCFDDETPSGYAELWNPYQLGREQPIFAAQVYAYAYQQTGEKSFLETAKHWAKWIESEPPTTGCVRKDVFYKMYANYFSKYGTYAGLYGRTISFFVNLYAVTGNASYLNFAQDLADEAISKLYYKGLFRDHPAKPYYSSVGGVPYLLVALLQLNQVVENKSATVKQQALISNGEILNSLHFDNL